MVEILDAGKNTPLGRLKEKYEKEISEKNNEIKKLKDQLLKQKNDLSLANGVVSLLELQLLDFSSNIENIEKQLELVKSNIEKLQNKLPKK